MLENEESSQKQESKDMTEPLISSPKQATLATETCTTDGNNAYTSPAEDDEGVKLL